MKLSAFAKLNLGLELCRRRPDGYHDIRTLFQSIELGDRLELAAADELALEVEGDAPAGADNLVWLAAQALARQGGIRAGARLKLHKFVPAGAGLGGGSSDAAATLVGLNRLWALRAGTEDLYRLALELGSDVPYFLLGGTALGTGRGEELWSLADLPPMHVVIVPHSKPLATAEVYRLSSKRLTERESYVNNWCFPRLWSWDNEALSTLSNDLEEGAFQVFPELAEVKQSLRGLGAALALLTGSGSAVYGLFQERSAAAGAQQTLESRGVTSLLTRTLSRENYIRSQQSADETNSRRPKEAP